MIADGNNRYKYLDCYTKQTSYCALTISNNQWTVHDDLFPNVVFTILGKCSSKDIDTTLFQDNLPVISHDNYCDLLGDGVMVLMGRTIDSILNHLVTFDDIENGDIIVIEKG